MKLLKIKSVKKKYSDKPVPVYDIEVEKNHNFALYNGAVVHNCEPYAYFKNCIYEKRLTAFKNNLLAEEIAGLERNGNTGKIDHPDGGRFGSKDSSDAVCGAIWNASKHADEFSFEYGDLLDTTVEANSKSYLNEKQQITVDFEEELKKAFSGAVNQDQQENNFVDFGFGKAKPLADQSYYYWSQGIII